MKSAYELAMERLNKTAPPAKLTAAKRKELAELDAKYAAKIAEREIYTKSDIAEAAGQGDGAKIEEIEQRLVQERKSLQAELEEKKEQVRKGKA